MGEAVGFACF